VTTAEGIDWCEGIRVGSSCSTAEAMTGFGSAKKRTRGYMAEVQHGSISCRSYDVIDEEILDYQLPYFIAVLVS